MLWLALYFPLLPLEALPIRQSPSAVVSHGRIRVADAVATEAGVRPDQRLSTALGLQPGLAVFERDEAREATVLHGLACWAGRFTPTLSILPSATLLLEIGGCLRLFGGAQQIVEQALAGCAEQSFTVTWAAGPTPLGALWLARAKASRVHHELADLQKALAALPCGVAGWPEQTLARLDAFGLKLLGDLRQQPAAGLRRRLGNAPMNDLARAWGELPDPQKAFVFPETFSQKIELPARVEHAEALAFAALRLFSALLGWLQARQLLVRACSLQLTHDDGTTSDLPLHFAEPAADEQRFSRLLREHLGRLQLSAPVAALSLRADEVLGKLGASASLFDQATAGEGALLCLERLRARLGQEAVQVLAQRPDYRPECATHSLAIDEKMTAFSPSTVTIKGARPLWLLPAPQALAEVAGRPSWHGRLSLLSSAERLESGWWDEGENQATGDVRRDYFVARNPLGQWVWIFRDAQAWYLHGLFA